MKLRLLARSQSLLLRRYCSDVLDKQEERLRTAIETKKFDELFAVSEALRNASVLMGTGATPESLLDGQIGALAREVTVLREMNARLSASADPQEAGTPSSFHADVAELQRQLGLMSIELKASNDKLAKAGASVR